MRKTRMFATAVSVALLGAAAAAGGTASAQTTGVGTTRATTTAVSVSLGSNGSLLDVQVLGDNGIANIDPKQGAPSSAASSLSPLTSTSSVSALNISVPKVSASSTGAADNNSVPSIDLTTPLSTGSIAPLSLSAVVDPTQGAASGLSSSLKNLTTVAGLLSLPSGTSSLGAAAKPGDADGLRGLSIPDVSVLNLGATLQGLGISSAAMQLGQVGNVLNTLGVTVPNGSAPALTGTELVTQVTALSGVLTNTLAQVPPGLSGVPPATPIATLPPAVTALINGLIPGGIPAGASTVGDLVTAVNGQITGLLNGALSGITNAPLLEVKNLVVGITTKAADTVANSVATVTASLGSVQIGSLTVPGVDLASVLGNANTTINQVLTQAGLGNLITVKALDQSKSIGTQNGYVNSLANLTGVDVAIAPLSSLAPGTPPATTPTVGSLFTLAGAGAPPALSSAMQTLNGVLATTGAGALAQGATVDVLQVGSASTFTPSASATPTNPSAATPQNATLATTGGPTQVLGFVGLLLLATVAGLRWLRRPATTD
ncbi:MAG: hypothetical protein JOZ04_16105 [Acidimicrobiia bacterium]|nr:hypothetical protein [Acidimicrobiia bacterium]